MLTWKQSIRSRTLGNNFRSTFVPVCMQVGDHYFSCELSLEMALNFQWWPLRPRPHAPRRRSARHTRGQSTDSPPTRRHATRARRNWRGQVAGRARAAAHGGSRHGRASSPALLRRCATPGDEVDCMHACTHRAEHRLHDRRGARQGRRRRCVGARTPRDRLESHSTGNPRVAIFVSTCRAVRCCGQPERQNL